MKKRYLFVQVEVAQVFQDCVEKSSGQPWDTLLLKKFFKHAQRNVKISIAYKSAIHMLGVARI